MKMEWKEPLTQNQLDYLLHKFKAYLGSVSREIQNRSIRNQKEECNKFMKNYGNELYEKEWSNAPIALETMVTSLKEEK